MLARGTSILTDAQKSGRAVAGITAYTLESIRAICTAAQRTGRPAMIQAGSGSFRGVGREPLAAAALAAATAADVPIGVHLDHATDRDEISVCIALGYTSVMVDGSHLPFEDNIAFTRSVVDEAHAAGVWVEAELGGLCGHEDASSNAASGELTDPVQAAEFAQRTGADALAVAVGTVHGFTSEPVQLDLARLRRIGALTPVPLVLHGASGLPDSVVTAALAAGVVKVNINAEMRRAHLVALEEVLAEGHDDIVRIQARAVEAMSRTAAEKLTLLAGEQPSQPKANKRTPG
jgi:ketose-bisphosphate aldolase